MNQPHPPLDLRHPVMSMENPLGWYAYAERLYEVTVPPLLFLPREQLSTSLSLRAW